MRKINEITVHCSATTPEQNIGASTIRTWHKAKGWSDIGYHFVIRRSGEIEPGRPLERIGAHVKGHNANSIGICLEGGINEKGKPENNFTKKQFYSLRILIDNFKIQFKGALVRGHRDYSPDKNKDGKITKDEWLKVCPCFDVRGWYYGSGNNKEQNRKHEVEEQEKDGMDKLQSSDDSNSTGNSKIPKRTGRKRSDSNNKPS